MGEPKYLFIIFQLRVLIKKKKPLPNDNKQKSQQ